MYSFLKKKKKEKKKREKEEEEEEEKEEFFILLQIIQCPLNDRLHHGVVALCSFLPIILTRVMTEGNIVFYPLLEEGLFLHDQISVLMWCLLNCFKEFCSTFYIEFQSSLINVTVEAGNWN